MRFSPLLLLPLVGCIVDRTGQSTTTVWRKELDAHAAHLAQIDKTLDAADARVSQLEELTRARGQDDILKMENLDQIRQEVANMRGELEVLSHQAGAEAKVKETQAADVAFRVAWLETRAESLERTLGVKAPPPPNLGAAGTAGAAGAVVNPAAGGGSGTPTVDPNAMQTTVVAVPTEEVTDPDELLKLAGEHLVAGRPQAAEAVLTRFIKEYPKHARIAEAKYRFAEARFNAKDYGAAVLRFQDVIDNYNSSKWAPYAMLRQGECFEAQGQKANAKVFYEDVVRLWPKSDAAKEAKAKLGK